MSERIIFDHEEASRFIVGTVGSPGERAFYIQVRSTSGITTVAVEKSQVIALSERLRELVTEVRRSKLASLDELGLAPVIDSEGLEFPIDEEFKAGEFTELISDEEDLADVEDPPDLLRLTVRLNQVKGFCNRAEKIVTSGRPVCPFCGLPIDTTGHLCPRANGYRR